MEPEQAAPPLAVRLGAAAAVAWLTFWWLGAQDWIQYPFALEWQESAMFEHASRAAQGLPVYQQPSVDFTAFPYPPLFHWLGAALVGEAGGDLSDLRSVSVLSLMLALACVVLAGQAGTRFTRAWGAKPIFRKTRRRARLARLAVRSTWRFASMKAISTKPMRATFNSPAEANARAVFKRGINARTCCWYKAYLRSAADHRNQARRSSSSLRQAVHRAA